jgi:osmotically inducible protein OsmC
MNRTASAIWTGGLKQGKGSISTQSGIMNKTQYGFGTRFGDGTGTNPEELIAAAHAGCFTMAQMLHTLAAVTLEKVGDAYSITAVHLDLVAKIPGSDQAGLEKIANLAKVECPVSRLLKAEITLTARLET